MERRSTGSSGLQAMMAALSSWLLLLLQVGSGVGVLDDASFSCPSVRYFCLLCFDSGERAEGIFSGSCGTAARGCFPNFCCSFSGDGAGGADSSGEGSVASYALGGLSSSLGFVSPAVDSLVLSVCLGLSLAGRCRLAARLLLVGGGIGCFSPKWWPLLVAALVMAVASWLAVVRSGNGKGGIIGFGDELVRSAHPHRRGWGELDAWEEEDRWAGAAWPAPTPKKRGVHPRLRATSTIKYQFHLKPWCEGSFFSLSWVLAPSWVDGVRLLYPLRRYLYSYVFMDIFLTV